MADPRPLPVTPRQLDALREYVRTGSVRQAAHNLGVRPLTVRAHLANVRGRLDAATVAEAVYITTRRGELVVHPLGELPAGQLRGYRAVPDRE